MIEQEILIDAPVDAVWRAVTEPEQVRQWFSDELDLEPKPGYDGSLTFTDKATHHSVTVHVTVQSVEPQRSYSYRWQHPQGTEPVAGNSTLVRFTLTPEGAGTRLRVVESGFEEMGAPESQLQEHTEGWAVHLGNLRTYVGRA
ncbi:SRPBCC family protein [Nonomuraea sediminis]|uniref:SRPBCC family protein n=1 Tax=Nonomuraea sediminis TaxID=2835864 RepID=UPI001BDD9E94|nr:SRPBCC family protein [Nonomuraea sediminis]